MKFYRILIITFFAYTLISCGGGEERKAAYMKKATASIEVGDFDKARIELKNVLQIDPKDGGALYQLGNVYEQQKDYRKAYSHYLKAEELQPELLVNHARLGRFYLLLMNDAEKAQGKVDLILSKEPNNADGLLLKAAVLLRKNMLKNAMSIAEDIVSNNPEHTESIAFLASLYVRNENIAEAITVLDTGIKNNQNNEKLIRLLAVVLVKNKDYERAENIYSKFLEKNPDSSASYNNLAIFYEQTGDRVKAEEVLRASVANDSGNSDRILTLIKYIKLVKGDANAIKELQIFVADNNSLGKLRVALGELLVVSDDKESAIEIYKQAAIDFSDEEAGVTSRIALAVIYISERNFDEASKVVEEVILISPNDPKVNMLRARLAVRDKDLEKAIISLRIVTKEIPENIEAYILLANVHMSRKNDEQAKNVMFSAYNSNKNNADALLKLAKYYASRDAAQALKVIESYVLIKPSDYEGLSMKAIILNRNNAQYEASKLAEKLIETYPDKANGYLQVVPYHIQKGDKQKAESILEKGYLNVKDNKEILTSLTTIQVINKKFDIVEKRIKAELISAPDDPDLKTMLAKVYMVKKDTKSAAVLLGEVVVEHDKIEEPYLLLLKIHKSEKNLTRAKAILIKGNKKVTSSIKIPLELARIYEVEGDYQNAIDVYMDIYKIKPNNLIVVNNLAALLSDHGRVDEDQEFTHGLINKLEKSDQPVFLDTVGWVYYKLENSKKAIQYLTQVIEKVPDVNVFNYHLGMAYKMSGDKEKAKIFLEKSLEDKKPFKERISAENVLKEL